MDIFPKERLFKASAKIQMVNKTTTAIDSVFLNHSALESTFKFSEPNKLVSKDTIHNC
jgi:ABC-2 type transport system permease protein